MATLSLGTTVTWGGVAFSEVVDVQVQYGGGQLKGRSVAWSDELGSVTVACLGTSNISTSSWGSVKDLVVSGGGISLTCKALYESVSAGTEINGVTRFAVTFKLLDL